MDYFKKIEKLDVRDILWNVSEQKQGEVNIIGGNANSFRTPVKIAEYLTATFSVKTVKNILPSSLKTKLPPLDNFVFLSSTDAGSFKSADELKATLDTADFNLMVGDFSKNAITEEAVSKACENPAKPLLITRDTVDIFASHATESALVHASLIIMATMPQLIKLLRTVYYPKMLILSEPLIQVAETLHKFTLSYPVFIITLHDGQIIIAKNGTTYVIPLTSTPYSPLSFWLGEAAARIAAFNLYNPNNFLDATSAALISP